ncbi:MAG TPA: TonB-dependent receptor [Acidobacteriaceae bacterium]|nr:TonB-dependent receptor [Acidobacteriaceae bacterium]
MNTLLRRIFHILPALLLLVATAAYAQFNASVQGTVQDAKGAVVPGASVTLVKVDTGVTQKTTSDAGGVYHFDSLAPGNYTVSSKASGFTESKVAFELTTDQVRDVPLTLTVAQVSSTVTVTSQAPLLDTSDSRFEDTLGTTALEDLPMPGRNPTSEIYITPGVTGIGSSAALNFNPENYVEVSANGQGQNGNQYVVDGMDVTSTIRPGVINLTPNVDVVQEMSVQTNTYTVDYGRAGSIQTVMTTKSGSNAFHGLASEYYTYQGLTARGEFGVPQPTPLNPYHSNNMSFAVGGPILPHKQFFFFVGYEPYLSMSSNGTSLAGFEDPAFVNFAQAAAPNSPEVQLMSKYPVGHVVNVKLASTAGDLWSNTLPTPAQQQACANGTGNVTAYDNVSIPCATPVFDSGNFNSSSFENAKQYNIRIDKYWKNDRAYGQFFRDTINEGGPSLRPAFNESSDFYTFSFQGNETHTFSPSTLNEAMFGYNRIEGISPKTGLFNVPIVNVNQLGTGWGDGFAEGDYIQHSYHWRDVLTHVMGSHSIKAGFEAWRSDDIALFAGAYDQPNLYYNNMIDFIANNPYDETGISYNPVTGAYDPANYGYKETTFGGFAEDTWKATRKLTVNYGIRYDNFGNPYVALKGTVLANFHLGTGSNFADNVANGVMTQQSHVFNKDMNWVFSPRAGVAWDPFGNGKWVVRGGIGLFHNEYTLGNAENGLKGNPPGYVEPTFYNNGSTAAPIFSYGTQNTVPFGFTVPAFAGAPLDAKGGIAGSQISVGGTAVNMSPQPTATWSVGVERQLTPDLAASFGYSGTHSWDMVLGGGNPNNTSYGVDINIFPGDLIQHPTFDSNGVWTGTGAQTRLNTSFGSIGYAFNGARANYHAFIAAIKGRVEKRWFLTASYTRSSAMDDWGNYPEGYVAGGGSTYDVNQWYSPSALNSPNRFSLGWSYDIPGVSGSSGLVRRLTNGFNLAGTTILQSGNPFFVANYNSLALVDTAGVTVTQSNYQSELSAGNFAFAPSSGNYSADGDNFNMPDVTSYKQKKSRKSYEYTGVVDSGTVTHGQFAQPAFNPAGTEGNEKPDQFSNPGYADTDFTVKKTTAINERLSFQLRLDVFNLFNRVNLNGVDTNYGDSSAYFGTTTSNLPPRNMVVGARLDF